MQSLAKQDMEARTESVRTGLTLAEKCYVIEQALAAGLTVAEYLRQRALGLPVAHKTERMQTAAIVNELNRLALQVSKLGNCANQIARAVNSDRSHPDGWDELPSQINDLLRFVQRELERMALLYDR